MSGRESSNKILAYFLLFSLALGFYFRLSHPGALEYKGDEKILFEASQSSQWNPSTWPAVGMISGAKVANPGASLWIFILAAQTFHLKTPIELARFVQILNCLALSILALYALSKKDPDLQKIWIWAAILSCLNIHDILLQRKLWAQSILPLFSVLFLLCWQYRKYPYAAFLMGILGMLLGQIHMSGFFFGAAFFLSYFFENFGQLRKISKAFLLGSFVAATGLLSWVFHLIEHPSLHTAGHLWIKLFDVSFWYFVLSHTFSVDLTYSFGKDLRDFLRYPLWREHSTYLAGLCWIALCILALTSSLILIRFLFTQKKHWKSLFRYQGPLELDLLKIGIVLYGLLIGFLNIKTHRHYLLVAFPLCSLLWPYMIELMKKKGERFSNRYGEKVLAFIAISQIIFAASFFQYLSREHGFPHGDFGVSYEYQPPQKP